MADNTEPRGTYDEAESANPDIVIYRITGAFFFGAAASIGSLLDNISDRHKNLIVDLSAVPFLDSTGANVIEGLARKTHRGGVQLWITGASSNIKQVLLTHGLREPLCNYAATVQEATKTSLQAYNLEEDKAIS